MLSSTYIWKIEEHICIEYVLYGACLRTPCRDFMVFSLKKHWRHRVTAPTFVPAGSHRAGSLDHGGSQSMMPWQRLVPLDMLDMLDVLP